MVDLYSAELTDGESAEHIGFCHILPNNLKQTNGTVSMPINGTSQQPIGQLTGERTAQNQLTADMLRKTNHPVCGAQSGCVGVRLG